MIGVATQFITFAMRDDDARRQGLAELHERRKQVIRLHEKQCGVMQIVKLTAGPGKIFLIQV